METLRDKLVRHGASIEFIDRICSLRLNASFRYKTEVEGIYDNLNREVEVVKVAEHQALYEYRK
jgi:hypothetical protein